MDPAQDLKPSFGTETSALELFHLLGFTAQQGGPDGATT